MEEGGTSFLVGAIGPGAVGAQLSHQVEAPGARRPAQRRAPAEVGLVDRRPALAQEADGFEAAGVAGRQQQGAAPEVVLRVDRDAELEGSLEGGPVALARRLEEALLAREGRRRQGLAGPQGPIRRALGGRLGRERRSRQQQQQQREAPPAQPSMASLISGATICMPGSSLL
jgi:hypothetical protein